MTRRLRPKFTGLYYDESQLDSCWIREVAGLDLPSLAGVRQLVILG